MRRDECRIFKNSGQSTRLQHPEVHQPAHYAMGVVKSAGARFRFGRGRSSRYCGNNTAQEWHGPSPDCEFVGSLMMDDASFRCSDPA